ncbi:MAG: hypothetical protein R3C44_22645 [Chloroflexota bacterium]
MGKDTGAEGGQFVSVTLGDELSGEVANLTAIDLGVGCGYRQRVSRS